MVTRCYDIIAVGGGLASASLAKAMAEQGAHVLVVERETAFKDRVRGEALAPWGVAEGRRARALPLQAQDRNRVPDVFHSGPEMRLDETLRRRFFGEE